MDLVVVFVLFSRRLRFGFFLFRFFIGKSLSLNCVCWFEWRAFCIEDDNSVECRLRTDAYAYKDHVLYHQHTKCDIVYIICDCDSRNAKCNLSVVKSIARHIRLQNTHYTVFHMSNSFRLCLFRLLSLSRYGICWRDIWTNHSLAPVARLPAFVSSLSSAAWILSFFFIPMRSQWINTKKHTHTEKCIFFSFIHSPSLFVCLFSI